MATDCFIDFDNRPRKRNIVQAVGYDAGCGHSVLFTLLSGCENTDIMTATDAGLMQ
jgi:hypothetical protein